MSMFDGEPQKVVRLGPPLLLATPFEFARADQVCHRQVRDPRHPGIIVSPKSLSGCVTIGHFEHCGVTYSINLTASTGLTALRRVHSVLLPKNAVGPARRVYF